MLASPLNLTNLYIHDIRVTKQYTLYVAIKTIVEEITLERTQQQGCKNIKEGLPTETQQTANGDEEKCFDRTQIFRATELGGYSQSVVPFIVQELIGEGLVRECNTRQEVGITQKGKQRLRKSIENNTFLILETLATEAPETT